MRAWIVLLLPVIGTTPSLSVAQQIGTYVARSVTDGVAVTGHVTYAGEAPSPKELVVGHDLEVCDQEPKFEESLIVATGTAGLQNVVAWLSDITEGKAWEEGDPTELNQIGCRFDPHVLIVPAGETFHIVNSDGILHNIHTKSSENRPINKAQPRLLKRLNITFRRPDILRVRCDVHNWMEAWISVAAHPYYAVTDENGTFELEDVPPGTYTLNLWHETLGMQTRQVVVATGSGAKVDVEYAPAQ